MTSCESEGCTVVLLSYCCTVVLWYCCAVVLLWLCVLYHHGCVEYLGCSCPAMIDSRGNYVANLLCSFGEKSCARGTYLGYAVCGMRESTDYRLGRIIDR